MLLFFKLHLIISGEAGAQPLPTSKEGGECEEERTEGEKEEERKGRSEARRREGGRREIGKNFLPAGHEHHSKM